MSCYSYRSTTPDFHSIPVAIHRSLQPWFASRSVEAVRVRVVVLELRVEVTLVEVEEVVVEDVVGELLVLIQSLGLRLSKG